MACQPYSSKLIDLLKVFNLFSLQIIGLMNMEVFPYLTFFHENDEFAIGNGLSEMMTYGL